MHPTFLFQPVQSVFLGKFLEHEIFNLKVGTLRMDPILEKIQIGHKTRTTHPNNLFEGVNHIVFLRWTNKKTTTTYNYLFLWSYGPISSHFWELPPFMAMFSDHNSWTTYPNFMFLSIFHNVLRCLIHQNHENIGLPLNIFSFLGKCVFFFTVMRNRPKLWTRNGSKSLRSNIARKTWNEVEFFVFD